MTSAPPSQPPDYRSQRWLVVRASRALVLGMFAMAAVGWIVTPYGVGGGLLLGLPAAVFAPRFKRLRAALVWSVIPAVIGVQLGVLLFGPGVTGSRFLSGIVAVFAVAPWLVILTFVVFARARSSGNVIL
jgi:hypothetical protein